MQNMHKKLNKKGFSLVELLVVITIIAILSVTAYVALGGQTTKAKNSRRSQDLSAIQSAVEIYFAENGKYPDQLDDGNTSAPENDLVPKYMPKMAVDPNGDNYLYGVTSTKKKYQLAATIENNDDTFKALVIGNSETDLIGIGGAPAYPTQAGVTYNGTAFVACAANTPVADGGSCVPYNPTD